MIVIRRAVAEVSVRPVEEQCALRVERRLFLKRRWRGVADDGTEFGFDLESRLTNGGVVWAVPERDYVVWQEPEVVYLVEPESCDEAALIGWKIGNLHMPVEIRDGAVRALHDPAVRQLLEREGWRFREESVVFRPLKVTPHAS